MSVEIPRNFVGVIGGSQADAALLADAETIGRSLAAVGFGIVCGGRGGVMEAVCRGAKSASGLTVGILPGSDRSEANRFVDVPIPTGMGFARNAIVAMSGDVTVAVGGMFGTLSEIAYSLIYEKYVIAYKSWDLGTGREVARRYVAAATPAEVLELVQKCVSAGERDG